jgi:uncharacterized protein YegL
VPTLDFKKGASMNRRTFDIIARYVSEEHGIKVKMSKECQGPRIHLDTMTIELPENIQEQNALAALSSLMHEAAHMKYSTIIPKDFSKTNVDHFIVNAIEDARIDNKNFYLLPNVWEFYEKFVKDHMMTKEYKAKLKQQPMLARCMIMSILMATNFNKYAFDKEAKQFIYDKNLQVPFYGGISAIEDQRWEELRRNVDEIKSHFNMPEQPMSQQGDGDGQDKKDCSGAGQGHGKGQQGSVPPNGNGKDKDPTGGGNAGKDVKDALKDANDLLRPASCWGKGSGLKGPGGKEFNPIELQQNTRNKFVETLNIKERYTENAGTKLNVDNLVSFFTGDVEELFIEDEIEKIKRSKIVFCLDASGSMGCPLMDNKMRNETLAKTVQSLIDILNEVRETEGLNVEYDILAFESQVHHLQNENWQHDYNSMSGGTNLIGAVQKATELLSDSEIDGNKIMILVTDGEVSQWELDEVKSHIQKNDSDVKAVLIGVGAGVNYQEKVCGDNNIICLEHAEQILMEAIQQLLEV